MSVRTTTACDVCGKAFKGWQDGAQTLDLTLSFPDGDVPNRILDKSVRMDLSSLEPVTSEGVKFDVCLPCLGEAVNVRGNWSPVYVPRVNGGEVRGTSGAGR